MSQDIVADGLNQIMNAKKAKKKEVVLAKHSKILRKVLDLAKDAGYLDYSVEGNELTVKIDDVNEIRAIKPRYTVSVKKINAYVRRYLPAKNFGFVVVSTSKGIMKHEEAEEQNIGGCLLAYMY
ncbi:30S ribosomal protein S8 [Candidatus Pacearchaeota archaeon]|jgi:small subunit ribosomal protein S8|nr:30S ribosomal protein S8 [Candidatus Pacearchaeota archaeon]|tara:strand:- start:4669 stop:5040 length:372 start_codon:yes stop_codon:yes gene_type:complete